MLCATRPRTWPEGDGEAELAEASEAAAKVRESLELVTQHLPTVRRLVVELLRINLRVYTRLAEQARRLVERLGLSEEREGDGGALARAASPPVDGGNGENIVEMGAQLGVPGSPLKRLQSSALDLMTLSELLSALETAMGELSDLCKESMLPAAIKHMGEVNPGLTFGTTRVASNHINTLGQMVGAVRALRDQVDPAKLSLTESERVLCKVSSALQDRSGNCCEFSDLDMLVLAREKLAKHPGMQEGMIIGIPPATISFGKDRSPQSEVNSADKNINDTGKALTRWDEMARMGGFGCAWAFLWRDAWNTTSYGTMNGLDDYRDAFLEAGHTSLQQVLEEYRLAGGDNYNEDNDFCRRDIIKLKFGGTEIPERRTLLRKWASRVLQWDPDQYELLWRLTGMALCLVYASRQVRPSHLEADYMMGANGVLAALHNGRSYPAGSRWGIVMPAALEQRVGLQSALSAASLFERKPTDLEGDQRVNGNDQAVANPLRQADADDEDEAKQDDDDDDDGDDNDDDGGDPLRRTLTKRFRVPTITQDVVSDGLLDIVVAHKSDEAAYTMTIAETAMNEDLQVLPVLRLMDEVDRPESWDAATSIWKLLRQRYDDAREMEDEETLETLRLVQLSADDVLGKEREAVSGPLNKEITAHWIGQIQAHEIVIATGSIGMAHSGPALLGAAGWRLWFTAFYERGIPLRDEYVRGSYRILTGSLQACKLFNLVVTMQQCDHACVIDHKTEDPDGVVAELMNEIDMTAARSVPQPLGGDSSSGSTSYAHMMTRIGVRLRAPNAIAKFVEAAANCFRAYSTKGLLSESDPERAAAWGQRWAEVLASKLYRGPDEECVQLLDKRQWPARVQETTPEMFERLIYALFFHAACAMHGLFRLEAELLNLQHMDFQLGQLDKLRTATDALTTKVHEYYEQHEPLVRFLKCAAASGKSLRVWMAKYSYGSAKQAWRVQPDTVVELVRRNPAAFMDYIMFTQRPLEHEAGAEPGDTHTEAGRRILPRRKQSGLRIIDSLPGQPYMHRHASPLIYSTQATMAMSGINIDSEGDIIVPYLRSSTTALQSAIQRRHEWSSGLNDQLNLFSAYIDADSFHDELEDGEQTATSCLMAADRASATEQALASVVKDWMLCMDIRKEKQITRGWHYVMMLLLVLLPLPIFLLGAVLADAEGTLDSTLVIAFFIFTGILGIGVGGFRAWQRSVQVKRLYKRRNQSRNWPQLPEMYLKSSTRPAVVPVPHSGAHLQPMLVKLLEQPVHEQSLVEKGSEEQALQAARLGLDNME